MSGEDVSRETSPLRDAIRDVFRDYDWLGTDSAEDMTEQVLAAVERVPVKVTIRDLDMDAENIVTIDGDELAMVGGDFYLAHESGQPLHLTVDQGDLKVKIGNGSWSPPIMTEEYTG